MSSEQEQSLVSEFPVVPLSQWRAKTGPGLERPTVEGVTLRPLYGPDDGEPGPRPPARSPGWSVGLGYAIESSEALVQALREDAGRGLELAWIELHGDLRSGAAAPVPRSGARVDESSLDALLAVLEPGVALRLHAGAAAPALTDALLRRRGADGPADAVLADPLATLASTGGLGSTLTEAYAALARTTARVAGRSTPWSTILVDGVPAHDAGASAELEIAVVIASGIEHLQRLAEHGLAAAQAMPHVLLRMAASGDVLVEVAKLRAVRRLWARVRAHAGADAGPPTPLHVETSWRGLTQRDPWVNLLRGTVATLAAVVAGASSIAVQPFTAALGQPDADARRWAINTQHVLRGESHLGAVDDPAAGSWAFEALTDELARAAWSRVRTWLSEGGIAARIESGQLQSELAAASSVRSHALATGQRTVTGTTAFPLLDESRPTVEPAPKPSPAAKASPVVTAPPLLRRRETEPFEALRDRADVVTRQRASRPRALLVPVGEARQARPVVDFARNFVEVGGFESTVLGPDSTLSEKTRLAIVCGTPDALAQEGPAGIRRLLTAGIGRVLVAGRPTDALREAGAHDFVHRGRDVVSLLSALQADLWPADRKGEP